MSFDDFADEVFDAIRVTLETNWTVTPIAWPNEDFEKPNPPTPWVDVEFTRNIYAQESIGAAEQSENRWDEDGQLWLHLLVPVGTGSSAAGGAAKALAKIFRGRHLLADSLDFLDASIGMGEPGDENGNYWRISTSIEWRRMDAP